MICHGQGDKSANAAHGDVFLGGCCHFPDGRVCPMRWFIDAAGDVFDSSRTNLGPLDTAIRSQFGVNNPNIRGQVKDFIGRQDGAGPVMYVCTAFGFAARDHWAEFMAQTGGVWQVSSEAVLEQRWSEEYETGGSAVAVGDVWAAGGKPRNWCVTYGPSEGQCCFREDQATNDANAAAVTTTRVSVSGRSTLGGG